MAGEQTRDRILAAALIEFDENGYEATTVARICKRAAVSNGSFFHAFPSKEALASALFLTALEAYHAALIETLSRETSAADGVSALVSEHIDWVIKHRAMARFMFDHPRVGQSKEVAYEQKAANERFRALLAEWIEPRLRSGALRRIAPEVFVSQIIGPAQLFCRAWLSGRSKVKPSKHKSQLIDCAIRATLATD